MEIREAAAILGVSQDANIEQVRNAYRSHARLLHPDRLAGASDTDRHTAHSAMARINDAYATFEAHFRVARDEADPKSSASKPQHRASQAPPGASTASSASEQPQGRRHRIAQFDALLSHPRGWDLAGVLQIVRTDGDRNAAIFRSDAVDARGTPVIDEEIFLAPGIRMSPDGTLTLRDGGYLVLTGGRLQAERVLSYLGVDPSLARPRRPFGHQRFEFLRRGRLTLVLILGGIATIAVAAMAALYVNAAPNTSICSPGASCAVGDMGPGGGTVFYDAGSPQPWGRYLEVAPSDWSGGNDPNAAWCSTAATIDQIPQFFMLEPGIGLGASNTQQVIDQCGDLNAAGLAADYSTTVNGETIADWYLPSQGELSLLDQVPGALTQRSGAYWSSSSCPREEMYSLPGQDYITAERVGGLAGLGSGSGEACLNQGARLLVRPIRAF